jgi:hypothetical protein
MPVFDPFSEQLLSRLNPVASDFKPANLRRGQRIFYVGKAIERPGRIKGIAGVVVDVTNEALTFHTNNVDVMFGILARDCVVPELDATISPVERKGWGSWTK